MHKQQNARWARFTLATALTATLTPWAAISSELPLYCKHRPPRGLTPDQENICKQDPARLAEEKRKAEELQPPVYPFKRSGFLTVEPKSGQQIGLSLLSDDGSVINVDFANQRPALNLKAGTQIISWKSANAGSGTDASGAVSVAVAGALFFWPMMLAAPFMVKNYTITGFQVEYIDQYGKDVSLDFATIEGPRPTMELLRFSTGLVAGTKRGADVTKPLYEAGLKNSMDALDALKEPLLVKNTKKPWCSTLKLGDNKQSTDYTAMLTHINALRSKLSLSPYEDMNAKSSDVQWEQYLASRPGLKTWAQTYKQQAEALRAC